MHEGVDAGLGEVRTLGQIGLGREKWPGVPAFQTSVDQVVNRGVPSRRDNVGVRFQGRKRNCESPRGRSDSPKLALLRSTGPARGIESGVFSTGGSFPRIGWRCEQ